MDVDKHEKISMLGLSLVHLVSRVRMVFQTVFDALVFFKMVLTLNLDISYHLISKLLSTAILPFFFLNFKLLFSPNRCIPHELFFHLALLNLIKVSSRPVCNKLLNPNVFLGPNTKAAKRRRARNIWNLSVSLRQCNIVDILFHENRQSNKNKRKKRREKRV